jgi:hypothetical protein
MAGGPKITDQIQQLIVETYLEHPDWVAKEVQKAVDDEVRRRGLAIRGPGLSAVQKKLAAYRSSFSKQASLKTFQTPWSLGSLCNDDIAPDAIPVIYVVQKLRRLREEDPLTVLEAKWVARLYRFFFHPTLKADELKYMVNEDKLEDLSIWAQWYAARELAAKVANIPLNTSDFDLAMATGRMEAIAKYIGTTNTISEVAKRRAGQKLTREFEQKVFGENLDEYDLSGKVWWAYIYALGVMTQNDKWGTLDDDRQKSLIIDLRNWIIQNERNPNLFEDIDTKWPNEIEGGYNNEGAHRQER